MTRSSHRRRPRPAARRLAVALVATVAAAFAAPTVAQAAPYTLDLCRSHDTAVSVPGSANVPDGVSLTGAPQYSRTATCAAPNGYLATALPAGVTTNGVNTNPLISSIAFDAGPELTVGDYSVRRTLTRPNDPNTAMLYTQFSGAGYYYEWSHCYFDAACAVSGVSSGNGGGSNAFALQLVCDGPCDGGSLSVTSLRVALHDGINPVFTADPTGSLTATSSLQGTVATQFSASDQGSGIHDTAVLFGSTVVSSVTETAGSCDAAIKTVRKPCPGSLTKILSVDTTLVADGSYPVTVRVRDVGGNVRSFNVGTKAVDNVPAPGNTSAPAIAGVFRHAAQISTDAGAWTGAGVAYGYQWQRSTSTGWEDIPGATGRTYMLSDGDVGKRMRSKVTAANSDGTVTAMSDPSPPVEGPPSPVLAPQPGQNGSDGRDGTGGGGGGPGGADGTTTVIRTPNGDNPSRSVKLQATFARSTKKSMTVPYGRPAAVTGLLLGADGKPVTHARLEVLTRPKVAGGAFAATGTVTADAKGKFRFLAPKGGSRVVRFAYKTYLQDETYAQTSDVELNVRPRVSLKPSKRSVRNKQSVTLTGGVTAAPKTSRKLVEIQALDGRQWRTIATTRLKGGRFAYRYRFTRTFRSTTFAFRARVRQESGWGFATGQSKAAKVKVRG